MDHFENPKGLYKLLRASLLFKDGSHAGIKNKKRASEIDSDNNCVSITGTLKKVKRLTDCTKQSCNYLTLACQS